MRIKYQLQIIYNYIIIEISHELYAGKNYIFTSIENKCL